MLKIEDESDGRSTPLQTNSLRNWSNKRNQKINFRTPVGEISGMIGKRSDNKEEVSDFLQKETRSRSQPKINGMLIRN